MVNRELGMEEFHRRVRPLYNAPYNLKQVMRLPSRAVDENDMPCVLILEGNDNIIKRSGRDYLGYGCQRSLDVIVECWDFVTGTGNVRNIYENVRTLVLANKGVLLQGVFVREERAEGPFNAGIPNVLGMRAIFSLTYKDLGPTFPTP